MNLNYFYEHKFYKGLKVDIETLNRIIECVGNYTTKKLNSHITTLINGEKKKASLNEIEEKFKTLKLQPKYLKLNIAEDVSNQIDKFRVQIEFLSNGEVEISGNFDEERIDDQEYPGYAKNIILKRSTKRIMEKTIIGGSLILLSLISYMFYAQNVGADLKDESITIQGNDYYNKVEDAIKSDSISDKLNTLLTSELRGVTSVSTVIELSH